MARPLRDLPEEALVKEGAADMEAEPARGLDFVVDELCVTTRGLAVLGQPELALYLTPLDTVAGAQERLRDIVLGIVSCGWRLVAGDVLEDGRGGVLRLRPGRGSTLAVEADREVPGATPEDGGDLAPPARR